MKNRSTIFIIILSVLACFGLFSRAQAQSNTATGVNALNSVTTGGFNTADGWFSQAFLTDAFFNTGDGAGTLALNDGSNNTAVGAGAMLTNLFGTDNVAVGVDALVLNTVAINNNAVGFFALFNNDSSALGLANFNNAHGNSALFANVDGFGNNAFGDGALANSTGNSNTALGDEAGLALFTGEGNIYIGAQQTGVDGDVEFIRIGNDTAFAFPYDTFIAGIFDRDVDAGTALFVFVDDTGKLGTNLVDAKGNKVATPQAMLDESRNQQKRIAELEGTVERLAAMVKEQAAQIQKVSAQLEVSKPAPQVVVNKP